jgi:hypothetical protein
MDKGAVHADCELTRYAPLPTFSELQKSCRGVICTLIWTPYRKLFRCVLVQYIVYKQHWIRVEIAHGGLVRRFLPYPDRE